jgi:hypothetical protein
MNHQQEEMSNKKQGRVEVNDLPPKQEELREGEAKDVTGGGGSVSGTGDIRTKNPGLLISE